MKRNIYFILVACIVISCSATILQLRQNKNLKKTNLSLTDSINELNNLTFNLADGISTAYKYAHHKELRTTILEDESYNKINILNDSTKIIFKFGSTNCLSSVKYFCSILHQHCSSIFYNIFYNIFNV